MSASKKRPRTETISDAASVNDTVDPSNLSDTHDFIAPNELCTSVLGLLHFLMTKHLISMSFSALYHKSLKDDWNNILTRERRSLKANVNSIEKCFMINRLLAECSKDPNEFVRRVQSLYDAIKMRMSSTVPSSWNRNDLYREVQAWRELQCKRRLFHINHEEAGQLHSLLALQQAATDLFCNLFPSASAKPSFWHSDEHNRLSELFRHSLIIVAQPSSPDCVAATKYEKNGPTTSAILQTRIICLLDPYVINGHVELSSIGVTIYPLNRQLDPTGEVQPSLQWQMQELRNSAGEMKRFYFAQLNSITLSKVVQRTRGLTRLDNNQFYQIEFSTKIKLKKTGFEETLTMTSQPFGICSHAQYFPELVVKMIIFEIQPKPSTTNSVIPPATLTDYICRYHTRVSGVEPKYHTRQFIEKLLLQAAYDTITGATNATSLGNCEVVLAKLISQIGFFVDHPFLAMMYYDGIFLGVCDNGMDAQLCGSKDRPHISVRFSSLKEHQSKESAIVRFTIHDGQLTKCTFTKSSSTFIEEMLKFVYESMGEQATQSHILLSNHIYRDFSMYYDEDLHRLSSSSRPDEESYNPLIPILWNKMGRNNDPLSSSVSTDRCLLPNYGSTTQTNSFSDFVLHTVANGPPILYDTIAPTEAFTTFHAQENTNAGVPPGVILPNNAEISSDVRIRRIAEELTNHCGIRTGGASFISHLQNTEFNRVSTEPANIDTDDDDNLNWLLSKD